MSDLHSPPAPEAPSEFVCPVDVRHTTGEPCTLDLFFKNITEADLSECVQVPLVRDYGRALEQDGKIVVLQLNETKLACFTSLGVAEFDSTMPLPTISTSYDSAFDSLLIYLVDPDSCKQLRNSVIAESFHYGTDLILRCNSDGILFCISLMNASEYLPKRKPNEEVQP